MFGSLLAGILAFGLAACDEASIPAPLGPLPVRVEVRNRSNAPAKLIVRVPAGQIGPAEMPPTVRLIGGVMPDTVPPNTTMDVVVLVPPAGDWWLDVNGSAAPSGSDRKDLATAVKVWLDVEPDGRGNTWGFEPP